MKQQIRWAKPLAAGVLLSGCALLNNPTPKTGDAVTPTAGLNELSKVEVTSTEAKSVIKEFKEVNSKDNFTMPIGNNFTMPIGNNFTMPIGNNLIGNVGAGYRIAAAVSGQVLFGFVPIPSGADVVRTNAVTALPTQGSTTQRGTVKSGTTFDADFEMGWWADACGTLGASQCEGYGATMSYNTLQVPLSSGSQDVSGTYAIDMSGPKTSGNWTTDTSKFSNLFFLGQNANPSNMARRSESFSLKRKSDNAKVASLAVDWTKFQKLEIAIPKLGSQDASSTSIQLPGEVTVAGTLANPTAGTSMGVNLAASANFSAKVFTMTGWLKSCTGTTCTATAASSQTASGETRESFTLDVDSAISTLTFERRPKTGEKYGWRMWMQYDYGAALISGLGKGSPLIGELFLIKDDGSKVSGGKLANLSSDASGNVLLKYEDGTTETWKLF